MKSLTISIIIELSIITLLYITIGLPAIIAYIIFRFLITGL